MGFNPSGGSLGNATDVSFSPPRTNNQLMTYNSGLARWQNIGVVTESYTYQYTGTIAPLVGSGRVYLEEAFEIVSVRASVGTAPTGAPIKVDVSKATTGAPITIYGTQAARPTIAIGTFTATGGTPTTTTFAPGEYMTIDVDQVGSAVAGADLVVVVRLRRI